MKYTIAFILSLSLLLSFSFPTLKAQQQQQERTRVDFIRADDWRYNKEALPGAQVITGNVVFRHDSTYLYCDSAYFYRESNHLVAFSNVRMEQGDTLFVYGDRLYYDGNTKLARLRKNVRMINNDITLLTDSFNYDRQLNLAYFFEGGVIIDAENELYSSYGQYDPALKEAVFQYDVKLKNPKMNLFSDTLVYSTATKIADILGPSTIISDSTTIYSTRGWYNTQLENSMLLNRSTIHNKGTLLTGDSILYNRLTGIAEVFGKMYANDTIQKSMIMGDYGFYNELSEYVMATKRAQAVDYSTQDTMYIHGDTLKAFTDWAGRPIPNKRMKTTEEQRDSIQASRDSILTLDAYVLAGRDSASLMFSDTTHLDSMHLRVSGDSLLNDSVVAKTDSIFKIVRAYYGVRVYSTRMQAVCDSLQMSNQDTIINMYRDPIIWSDNYQLFGDFIKIHLNDSTIDKVKVLGYVFSAQLKGGDYYDQVSGKEMDVYFHEGDIRQIDVSGNVLSIYYTEEKDSTISQMIRTESSYMTVNLKNRKMERVKLFPEPKGIIYPIDFLTKKLMFLDRFSWYDYIRPLNKEDIFEKREKKNSGATTRRRRN